MNSIEQKNNENEIVVAKNFVRSGDIVLRSGKDELSKFFARLNTKNQSYSHCGVAIEAEGQVYIYHIIRSEIEGQSDVRKELFSDFTNSKYNHGFAVIRNNISVAENDSFCSTIKYFYRQKIQFDTKFDLESDDKMYCSEMIFKALIQSTNNKLLIQSTSAESGKKYIAIDNLFDHKNCKTICEISY